MREKKSRELKIESLQAIEAFKTEGLAWITFLLGRVAVHYIFQLEDSGMLHLHFQGCLEAKRKTRGTQLCEWFNLSGIRGACVVAATAVYDEALM